MQLSHLAYETPEMRAVQLGRRGSSSSRVGRLGHFLQEAQLRERHGHSDELLLAAREHSRVRPCPSRQADVGPVRAHVR